MARFRCRDCFGEAKIEYRTGIRSCSRCGSHSVQIALSIKEIPDDDPLWDAFRPTLIVEIETGSQTS
jgi:hypothetical protein